jgi:hypothetical protein
VIRRREHSLHDLVHFVRLQCRQLTDSEGERILYHCHIQRENDNDLWAEDKDEMKYTVLILVQRLKQSRNRWIAALSSCWL